jgi:hypothetical protein
LAARAAPRMRRARGRASEWRGWRKEPRHGGAATHTHALQPARRRHLHSAAAAADPAVIHGAPHTPGTRYIGAVAQSHTHTHTRARHTPRVQPVGAQPRVAADSESLSKRLHSYRASARANTVHTPHKPRHASGHLDTLVGATRCRRRADQACTQASGMHHTVPSWQPLCPHKPASPAERAAQAGRSRPCRTCTTAHTTLPTRRCGVRSTPG